MIFFFKYQKDGMFNKEYAKRFSMMKKGVLVHLSLQTSYQIIVVVLCSNIKILFPIDTTLYTKISISGNLSIANLYRVLSKTSCVSGVVLIANSLLPATTKLCPSFPLIILGIDDHLSANTPLRSTVLSLRSTPCS